VGGYLKERKRKGGGRVAEEEGAIALHAQNRSFGEKKKDMGSALKTTKRDQYWRDGPNRQREHQSTCSCWAGRREVGCLEYREEKILTGHTHWPASQPEAGEKGGYHEAHRPTAAGGRNKTQTQKSPAFVLEEEEEGENEH